MCLAPVWLAFLEDRDDILLDCVAVSRAPFTVPGTENADSSFSDLPFLICDKVSKKCVIDM